MGRPIVEHEGTPERFSGDGMRVFFDDPLTTPEPAGPFALEGARSPVSARRIVTTA